MANSSGLHHISKRKRVHKKLEQYPHPQKWIRALDKLLIFIAVLGPLLALPQVLKIFIYKSAEGVSFISWLSWLFLGIPWLLYGFVHKEKPIIVAYILWTFMHFAVVLGILLYG
jgi:uncharacterized protein with PQ loop repeat